jgi:hypothetical protein
LTVYSFPGYCSSTDGRIQMDKGGKDVKEIESVLELAFWISNMLGREIVSVAQGAGKEQQRHPEKIIFLSSCRQGHLQMMSLCCDQASNCNVNPALIIMSFVVK